jgi:tetratricopeptide (TPR) repeat protein
VTIALITFSSRYEDAKRAYKRVLEIHPLHPTGLAFLGMTCHLQDEIDEAILHYHEVRKLFLT